MKNALKTGIALAAVLMVCAGAAHGMLPIADMPKSIGLGIRAGGEVAQLQSLKEDTKMYEDQLAVYEEGGSGVAWSVPTNLYSFISENILAQPDNVKDFTFSTFVPDATGQQVKKVLTVSAPMTPDLDAAKDLVREEFFAAAGATEAEKADILLKRQAYLNKLTSSMIALSTGVRTATADDMEVIKGSGTSSGNNILGDIDLDNQILFALIHLTAADVAFHIRLLELEAAVALNNQPLDLLADPLGGGSTSAEETTE
ncbi:MAG: hypothetical protein PHX68_02050 [Alphaproteobacteria bacterium]|nr:hypothetical protein [Alphaproteobacteria bacterium]